MTPSIKELRKIAKETRTLLLEMLRYSNSGHPGSSLSSVEILVALYFRILNKEDKDRIYHDKFLLSKGHAAPALYAVMILKGIISKDLVSSLRKGGSPLQGHPDERFLPELDFSSGSLGQNLSVASGYAIAQKKRNLSSKTYVLLGDGENQEGQIWEAAAASAHFKLNNLIAIVDNNKLQLDGPVNKIMSGGELKSKWEAFGWEVIEVNGHNFNELIDAMEQSNHDKPKCIIANTIKGKGVSFMENVVEWHSIHMDDVHDILTKAILELKEN